MDNSYSIVHDGAELPLSNLEQLELLRGAMEQGNPFRTRVRGFSMQPSICDGDVLTLSPIGSRPPAVGEIVAFVRSDTGQLAIHRIITRSGNGWLIQSDNRAEADGVLPLDQIIGRVTSVERNGRAIQFGFGLQARSLAWLARHERFRRLLALRRLPRQIASLSLRAVQSFAPYRTLAHRLCPHITIAKASDEDRDEIQARLSPVASGGLLHSDVRVTTFVAKTGAKRVGFARLVRNPAEHPSYPGHWLFSLYVWPRYRRGGFGHRLTRRVIEQAAAEGAPELLLLIDADNNPALRLCRQLGFEPVAGPTLESPPKTAARQPVIMRKALPTIEQSG